LQEKQKRKRKLLTDVRCEIHQQTKMFDLQSV
jgi:hypothetical protein